jgi:hypothetical protein
LPFKRNLQRYVSGGPFINRFQKVFYPAPNDPVGLGEANSIYP